MTKTAAVVFADGCEEIEGLTVVDVLRRMGVKCDIVGVLGSEIHGAHQIDFKADKLISDQLLDYDIVAFPGGYGNAQTLRRLHWHAMDCWMVMTIPAIRELKKKRSSWHQTVILKKNLRLLIKQATWLPVVVRQRHGPMHLQLLRHWD